MLKIGLIGLGYWGPNLVRCFQGLTDCKVEILCDRDAERLKEVAANFPQVTTTADVDEVLEGGRVDAVVIATPTASHFQLGRRALEAGLHTFIEKPLAQSSEECRQLIALAEKVQRTLFVGHVFLHSSPVAQLRGLVQSGELGDVCYLSSQRLNLGPVRSDVNALWDLAPHDISIMIDLLGTKPMAVSCCGLAHLHSNVQDVCNLTLFFEDNRVGIIHVSWLDPHKKRVMTVVGSRKMAVYDDVEPLEKIKVYDNGIEKLPYSSSFGEFQISYRYGDINIPRLDQSEPLKAECSDFIRSIVEGTPSRTDGKNGLQVVEVLEAAEKSMESHGVRVDLGSAAGQVPPAQGTESVLVGPSS